MTDKFTQWMDNFNAASAVDQGDPELLRECLKTANDVGLALWHAIQINEIDCLRVILNHTDMTNRYQRCLVDAVNEQRIECVREILKHCPATISDTTALRQAIKGDSEEIFDVLCPYFDLEKTHQDLVNKTMPSPPTRTMVTFKSLLEKQNLLEHLDTKELSTAKKKM